MDFTFSPAEAQVLLGLLASVVVPFLVSLFSKPTTNKYVKLGLALVTSLVGGALTVYIDGGLTGSVILAGAVVFMASQVHLVSWFAGMGWKDALEQLFSGE